jgi:hypothetical protein
MGFWPVILMFSWGTAHSLSGSLGSSDQLAHLFNTALPKTGKDQSPQHQTQLECRASPQREAVNTKGSQSQHLQVGLRLHHWVGS